ncbi:MAG: DPP IV N-terminal domain-containing protein [Pirellulales bacterium]
MRSALSFALCFCVACCFSSHRSSGSFLRAQDAGSSAASKLAQLKTIAESSDFLATARGSDVELFLKQLDRDWEAANLVSLGKTVEGRALWGLVVAPTVVPKEGKPLTVLLLGGIHSGECDGKESLLAMARDMALGKEGDAWKSMRLIFLPNFNADGNERVGKDHRPGQAGPDEGMGVRENAQGLDLNRDFVKLETPEVLSLIGTLNTWDVDVLIDAHTTNGSLHRYDLTYDIAHNPAADKDVQSWLRGTLLPEITATLHDKGLDTFYYGNFDAKHTKWETFGLEPRYSTEMMGLRGKIGILVESYSYASYERRIEANKLFIRELLNRLAADQQQVRGLLDRAAASSRPGATVSVRGSVAKTKDQTTVLGYQKSDGTPPSPPYNANSAGQHSKRDYEVELRVSAESTVDVVLPKAYAIAPQYAWAVSRLNMHGIQMEQLKSPLRTKTQQYKVTKVEEAEEFQGHRIKSVSSKLSEAEQELPAGTVIVRTAQPLGKLAAYLLEPSSADGLAAWNFLDPYIVADEIYPIVRLIEEPAAADSVPLHDPIQGERIAFDHIMRPGRTVEYSRSSTSGATWLAGSDDLLVRRDRDWMLADPVTGAVRPFERLKRLAVALVATGDFKEEEAKRAASPSALAEFGRFALVSHKNDLYFYDSESDKAKRLTDTPKASEDMAELTPTGKHVIFVRDNDLWAVDTATAELKRLTEGGSTELLNGILDWVYQEELYGRGNFKAFWPSPDGTTLAYLQLDQTPVLHYQVSDSTSVRQSLEDTRYPKAGDPLPAARMWLINLSDGAKREINLDRFPIDDRLVVRVTWSPKNDLWLQIQNRVQTEQRVVRVDPKSGDLKVMLEEKSPGWIEVLSEPKFLPSGDFLWLSDLPAGRRHLFRWDSKTEKTVALTSGAWDVAEITAVSADGKTAFVSADISHPTEVQILAVDTQSGEMKQITTRAGSHRATVSASGKYFIDSASNLDDPTTTTLRSVDGSVSRVLAAPISDRYRYLDISEPILRTIPARDGFEMQSMIMLPPGTDAVNSKNKFPVLFHVYGGPQAPTVRNAWQMGNYWWHQYLCQQGFAVVLCDNRASRGRGIADTWKIHKDMGRVELADLEDAVDWVGKQPWADKDRVGVWGWSYGGYFTAYALTHSKKFKVGIAGAPVTDWRNYDAIYTERYMGLPKDNEAGYRSSSTVTAAKDLYGRLLIIHGERDDNVHMSNTLQLANALQRAGKPFEMMIYPRNRHGITDPMQRFHLHQTMTEFLERNLK